MKYIVAILSALSACSIAVAQTTPKTEQAAAPTAREIQQAYQQIKSAPYFSVGTVGFAGIASDAEKGTEVLVRAQEARLLEALFWERNPVARLYALRGIQRLHHPQARLFAASLQQSDDTVPVLQGCLLSIGTLSDLSSRTAFAVTPITVKSTKQVPKKKQ